VISMAWGLLPLTGYMFAGLLFLLAVILSSLRLSRGPVLLMAAVSAIAWDYLFIEPRFTLQINQLQDIIMFVMFFIVALSMGHLTTRLRQRELAERKRQQQTAALLRVTQSAALSADSEKGLADALGVINELLNAETAMVVRGDKHALNGFVHRASTFAPSIKEWGVIHWTFQHKLVAGRFSDTLPQSAATWFPLQTATSLMGVFGVRLSEDGLMDFGTRQSIEAFCLQLALVLEKEHFIQAVKHADLLAQSERLQRSLLDSVSHELKTPIAIFQASLEALAPLKNPYVSEMDIALQRLRRVVNHLLEMSRIESSVIQPRKEWCLIGDVIQQARDIAGEALVRHPLHISLPPDLPAMKLDSMLLSQSIANVLHNASVYSNEACPIDLRVALQAGSDLVIEIQDHGPGLPVGNEDRVFEKFYRAPQTPAGGTGLGLPISRAFMQAMGGSIRASNVSAGGAKFTFSLPVELLPA
jgi:two-component system sensor histidine kinase KdpD